MVPMSRFNRTNRKASADGSGDASRSGSILNSLSFATVDVELVGVQLPCFVNGMDRAFEILGGEERVHETIAKKVNYLRAKFIRNDPLRQGLLSDLKYDNGLLLRLVRKRQRDSVDGGNEDANPFSTKITSVGIINSSYNFTSNFDYQFLPAITDKDLTENEQIGKGIIESIPRPMYSSHCNNKEFGLFTEKTKMQKEMNQKERVFVSNAKHLRFGEVVPETPKEFSLTNRGENKERSDIYLTKLRKLFQRRPAFSKQTLETLGDFRGGEYLLAQLLPKVAFHYTSGPWKGLWIRMGFDPATNPNARYLQIINVRLGSSLPLTDQMPQLLKGARDKLGPHLAQSTRINLNNMTVWNMTSEKGCKPGLDFFLFNVELKTQFSVQICDILDEGTLTFICEHMPRLNVCDLVSGWYSAETIGKLRTELCNLLIKRTRTFMAAELSFDNDKSGTISAVVRPIATANGPLASRPWSPPRPQWLACDCHVLDSTVGGVEDWYSKYTALPDKIDFNMNICNSINSK